MKKGCLIGAAVGIGSVAVIIIVIVAFVFWLTGGVVDAGNKFLSLLGEGKTQEAYLAADAALRSSQTEQEFTKTVKELSLTEYASAFWHNRSMENNVATLEGTVKTRSGGNVPLTMKLIKQAGGWKVLSLEGPKAGAAMAKETKQVPPESQLRKLTDRTLSDFNAAIQARSFAKFYETISALWKSQITVEKFQGVFQEFIVKQINLSAIEGVAPVYDEPPSINKDGVLVLSGYYPAPTLRVTFRLKFVYEHPAWRLFGINVQAREIKPRVEAAAPTGPKQVPPADDLRKLADKPLLDFNAAIQARSFAKFYETISALWKEQITADALQRAFQSFIDKQLDLSGIRNAAPVFDEPPSINSDGVLVLSGHYPAEPLRVNFRLKYVYENGSWKLIGINVNVKET